MVVDMQNACTVLCQHYSAQSWSAFIMFVEQMGSKVLSNMHVQRRHRCIQDAKLNQMSTSFDSV